MGQLENCPHCHHPLWEHRFEYPEEEKKNFRCFERMSYDNNDFCGCTHGAPKVEPLAIFYAVRNHKGEYYQTYGQRRCSGWVKDLKNARIWSQPGQAKAKITNLSHGKDPIPELVEFIVNEVKVVDQKARVAEAKRKALEEETKRAIAIKEQNIRYAQAEVDKAKARLERLKNEQ